MINYRRSFLSNLINTFLLYIVFCSQLIHSQMTAIITYEYYSLSSNYLNLTYENKTNGVVSSKGSQMQVQKGPAFTIVDSYGKYDGCQQAINTLNYSNGIAIIQRGGNCTFSVKITRAKQYGAAAVIVYDPQTNSQDTFDIIQNNSDILCLYVQRSIGSLLFQLANDSRTHLNITLEPINANYDDSNQGDLWYGSRGAIIFIIVSTCVLICSCFSWFIFYCFQQNRSRTTKDRLENRLINAAKKALTKIPLVTINENLQAEESCVVCLDTIKEGDTVRELTCRHRFHQQCIDPWLINHRHCPLCNLDILTAYRISIGGSSIDRTSVVSENLMPINYTSLVTTSPMPTIEHNNDDDEQQQEQQQVINHMQSQPIPTISGLIKDDMHGEENPSFRIDDEQ
ncbi:unnamed protein product [Rotaria sp. Silwood2]|nr:unnamed protein product [Rotaria sp. Silwood2]CAF2789485.1 unnamed protein product [Rotaria sp. Silwood2]CAF4028934.1 unnamed protein product [Rotaria sp. Silwood2]CAF4123731.1 unnamed protein product [Rotaria sp. Silwood2]